MHSVPLPKTTRGLLAFCASLVMLGSIPGSICAYFLASRDARHHFEERTTDLRAGCERSNAARVAQLQIFNELIKRAGGSAEQARRDRERFIASQADTAIDPYEVGPDGVKTDCVAAFR